MTVNPSGRERAEVALARYAHWMEREALPFWTDTGLSPDGGVVERMTLSGRPDRPGFKRVRVHARHLYVFSHAHVIGLPGMLAPARAAHDFLLAHGGDGAGGWVVKMGEAGGVVDGDLDLYDQAFVILALSWWARATGDDGAIALARKTLSAIETRFARPDGRGYLSRLPDRGEALQNPHMHLFEAVLALHETAPNEQSARVATGLRLLFDTALCDPQTHTLGEVFDMDWRPVEGVAGRTIEAGHHYEWVWLLIMAERQGIGTAEPVAGRLFEFAEAHGLASGDGACRALILNAVDREGKPLDARHRSWPQTERLKALAVRGAASGDWDHDGIADALEALMTHYIDSAPAGCWIDHVDAEGVPCVTAIPASTLYHLFLAYAELTRLRGAMFEPQPDMEQP